MLKTTTLWDDISDLLGISVVGAGSVFTRLFVLTASVFLRYILPLGA